MKKYTKKGLERKKNKRKGYKEFYEKHINKIVEKSVLCQECGCKLTADVSEIAHILPKNLYTSVATDDRNIIYLCGRHSKNQCHSNFDTFSNERVKQMSIFPLVEQRFLALKDDVTERLNYKVWDRCTV